MHIHIHTHTHTHILIYISKYIYILRERLKNNDENYIRNKFESEMNYWLFRLLRNFVVVGGVNILQLLLYKKKKKKKKKKNNA